MSDSDLDPWALRHGKYAVPPLSVHAVAALYDVPPWLVSSEVIRPRFARLRWRLRKVWPL